MRIFIFQPISSSVHRWQSLLADNFPSSVRSDNKAKRAGRVRTDSTYSDAGCLWEDGNKLFLVWLASPEWEIHNGTTPVSIGSLLGHLLEFVVHISFPITFVSAEPPRPKIALFYYLPDDTSVRRIRDYGCWVWYKYSYRYVQYLPSRYIVVRVPPRGATKRPSSLTNQNRGTCNRISSPFCPDSALSLPLTCLQTLAGPSPKNGPTPLKSETRLHVKRDRCEKTETMTEPV